MTNRIKLITLVAFSSLATLALALLWSFQSDNLKKTVNQSLEKQPEWASLSKDGHRNLVCNGGLYSTETETLTLIYDQNLKIHHGLFTFLKRDNIVSNYTVSNPDEGNNSGAIIFSGEINKQNNLDLLRSKVSSKDCLSLKKTGDLDGLQIQYIPPQPKSQNQSLDPKLQPREEATKRTPEYNQKTISSRIVTIENYITGSQEFVDAFNRGEKTFKGQSLNDQDNKSILNSIQEANKELVRLKTLQTQGLEYDSISSSSSSK